jgi:plasmid maintenance system antidote protein VapI
VTRVRPGGTEPDWVVHPGIRWRDIIETLGLTQAEVADAMNCPQQALNEILNAKKMPTAARTVAFADVVDVNPRLLWQFRADYELGLALGKADLTVDHILRRCW